ncbi:MAG TPA: alpha/beta hydrolase [Anaerolineales bacterium]|nr:alpha/beta hydrolase [Anaerolineales bacterium]
MPLEFPMRGEEEELSPTIRGRLPGAFIQLPDGVVHYELGGPENGPVVVLVHGFSVPYFIWDPTYKFLTKAGFRVLRYDLYGRGFSDRPHADYNLDLFDRQLVNLLDLLDISHCLCVVGLSMGGMIAANFAVQHPDKLDKLALVDPAGFALEVPFMLKLLTMKGVGEVFFSMTSGNRLENMLSDNFYDPDLVEKFVHQYRPAMHYKGFKRAILSTLRSGILEGGEAVYRQLGQRKDLPVLLFWGEDDETVPFEFSKTLLDAVPHAEFHPIANTGHIPHYEKKDEVNPILIEFLQQ